MAKGLFGGLFGGQGLQMVGTYKAEHGETSSVKTP